MSPDEVARIESVLNEQFFDAKTALAAALNELRVAAASPDAAEAVRAEVGGTLPVADAVLELAIRRGRAWYFFNRA